MGKKVEGGGQTVVWVNQVIVVGASLRLVVVCVWVCARHGCCATNVWFT